MKARNINEDRTGNRVELAATEIFTLAGFATGYHTSIVLDGEEYVYCQRGIVNNPELMSHDGEPSERRFIGFTVHSGEQLLATFEKDFQPGTYDMVRKNCNAFSDCALYFLLHVRLHRKYTGLEQLCKSAQTDILRSLLPDTYQLNPKALDFSCDETLERLARTTSDTNNMNHMYYGTGFYTPLESMCRPLYIGAQVTVVGLQSKEAWMNSLCGEVICYSLRNDKWKVRLHCSGIIQAFKAENLQRTME